MSKPTYYKHVEEIRMYYKYWDSDPYIRRILGQILAEERGLELLVPDPIYELTRLKGDKRFSYKKHIINHNPNKCIKELKDHIAKHNLSRANGNFDIVLYDHIGKELEVIEVKTRLVPRILYRTHDEETICNLLGYHLSSIQSGEEYWKVLKQYHALESLLDNPASIGELYKTVIAAIKYFNNLHVAKIYPAALIPTCRRVFIECVSNHLMDMYNSLRGFEDCININSWFNRIVNIGIPRLYCYNFDLTNINNEGIPRRLVIREYTADRPTNNIGEYTINNFDLKYKGLIVSGCRSCKYISTCRHGLYRQY